MRFAQASRTGDIVLRAEGLTKSYSGNVLFENVNLQIQRGQRWGILGANGCGKTTFLKCLIGDEPADRGIARWGRGVQLGYFDQSLKSVEEDAVAAEAIRPNHKEMVDQQRRDLLAGFGITGELALQRVGTLSGGERNRVALAFLAAQDANVLILDEPTNHLDLWSREALASALAKFEGTVVVVSHDRYFVNQICDHLMVFEPGRVFVFEGNYEDYLLMRHSLKTAAPPLGIKPTPTTASTKTRPDSPRRKRRFAYRKLQDIEADIAEHESAIEQLNRNLLAPEVLRDGKRVVSVQAELRQKSAELAQLYEHWEEAAEMN
jgi:ATP-binding cassette subfamily F protein 3